MSKDPSLLHRMAARPHTGRRCQLGEWKFRLGAAMAVILTAALLLGMARRQAPAESIAVAEVPLAAVAIRGASVSADDAVTALAAQSTASVATGDYAVSVDMYASVQLDSFAVADWNSVPYVITYTSSDESICTVDDTGLVTGVAAGTAAVTATAAAMDGTSVSADCTVTVLYAAPPLESIALNRSHVTLRMGGTGSDLSVSCTPEIYQSAMGTPVFTSSDPAVCTVDAAGHITAVAPGTATVTAAVGSLTAACAVTVKEQQVTTEGGISLLSFDHSMIASIGNQTSGRCSWYALRYARTILDGSICSGSGMWGNGVIWSAGGYSDYSSDLSSCLSKLYSELSAGRPVIVHLQNTYVGDGDRHANRVSSYEYWETASGWNPVLYPHIATSSYYGHWVCVVGVAADADPNNLKESDFYALDPARVTNGSSICVTRLLDGTIWVGNSPLKVAG